MLNSCISDLKCMQISSRIASDENLIKNYPNAFEFIKNSTRFNKREKEEILKLLKRVNPDNSFDKTYIGFE